MVAPRLQELVKEVAVGRVNLDPVEARVPGALRGGHVVRDDSRELSRIQSTGRLVRFPAERRAHTIAVDRDGRGGDRELTA